MPPSHPVVFFHIPKTAGTTLGTVFEHHFADRDHFLAGRSGSTHVEDCLRFIRLPPDDKRRYGYISGHLEIPVLDAMPNRPFAFTFLRKPLDRLVSLYFYVKRTPSHHVHPWIVSRNASLEDFLLHCPWEEVNNGMTRRLAGVPLLQTQDRAVLHQACCNIKKHFSFVGLQEYFDTSLFCLGILLGIDSHALVYTKQNVKPDAQAVPKLEKGMRKRILARNTLDCELYDIGVKLFRGEISQLLKGPMVKAFAAFKHQLKDSLWSSRRAAQPVITTKGDENETHRQPGTAGMAGIRLLGGPCS